MIQFGTGGWRAIIGDAFTKENIQILAKAMANKIKHEGVENKGIIIGYDKRFLSKEAMQWAGQVFAADQRNRSADCNGNRHPRRRNGI